MSTVAIGKRPNQAPYVPYKKGDWKKYIPERDASGTFDWQSYAKSIVDGM